MADLQPELERRASIADRVEQYFRDHAGYWISLMELVEHFGPAVTSRIRCDLNIKRHMGIKWNKLNGAASAYRFLEARPLGRDATEPAPLTQPRTLMEIWK